ncbi:MAG: OmpA family protein [Ignavibacteriae bacterium]|nr:OmpA family protein [Ignavibacteriota bacterium]
MRSLTVICTLVLLSVMCTVFAFGQDAIRAQLFGETDKLLEAAKAGNAHLYAPTQYEKAMEAYQDAEAALKKGKDLEGIRETLTEANGYFQRTLEVCKVGQVAFAAVMNARGDAISAEAARFSPEPWTKAEEQLKKAAMDLEDGDMNDAKARAGEAEGMYRTAELEAIKANYLGPARALVDKADEMDARESAPATITATEKLIRQAEELLKSNRYDTDEARQLAQEAKYEGQHAITLFQSITAFKKSERTLEDLITTYEGYLTTVGKALDMTARFDGGPDAAVNALTAEINKREAETARERGTIKRQEEEIVTLKQQIASMESRLGSLTEAERELKRRIEIQKRQEETFTVVSAMFTKQEGMVLRDGQNGIIRLYGLTFPPGRNTIDPQYFGLLTKVQEAIRKFGRSQVSVEGHTDSRGSDDANQKLSESRALAVAEYLRANMGGNFPIVSQGFGESKPVASNDTEDGRAKNRRIDIIIVPEWAVK